MLCCVSKDAESPHSSSPLLIQPTNKLNLGPCWTCDPCLWPILPLTQWVRDIATAESRWEECETKSSSLLPYST